MNHTDSQYSRLIQFLRQDLELSADSIAVAQRHHKLDRGPLPMVLLKYGLIDLDQLDSIYDWLERT